MGALEPVAVDKHLRYLSLGVVSKSMHGDIRQRVCKTDYERNSGWMCTSIVICHRSFLS
jgi:hypothetical protein